MKKEGRGEEIGEKNEGVVEGGGDWIFFLKMSRYHEDDVYR